MKRLLPLLLVGCAARPHPEGVLRFKVQPPVVRIDDAKPLAHRPETRDYYRTLYQLDGFVVRRLTRAMDFPEHGRALDTNSLDEVPDSTWFTNRIGARDLSIEELRRGPNVDAGPFAHLPWTITGAKEGGTAMGFVIEDANHDKYLLKFDAKGVPELETGAHIVGHRILWAIGYNVPEDYIGYVERKDIQLGEKATFKDMLGHKSKLTVEKIDHALGFADQHDHKFRVLVSRFVPGVTIGPMAREGVREDDPNDTVPHERRRTVRGEVAIFSWFNHTDIQEDNSLDTFVPENKDDKDDRRGHVVHYLIDFGKALGVMNNSNSWTTVGYTYRLDLRYALETLISFGLWNRPWDQLHDPHLRGVGLFDAKHFDPATWRSNSPYWPFDEADKFDGFWGAKLVMRFTRAQIAAIVDEAKYTDPAAAAYIVDTLVERQRRIGAYYFNLVSPLDKLVASEDAGGARLCFDDLSIVYGLWHGMGVYEVAVYDRSGARLGAPPKIEVADGGHACVVGVPLGAGADRYTIVKLSAVRGQRALPPVKVHIANTARGLEVIGLRRE